MSTLTTNSYAIRVLVYMPGIMKCILVLRTYKWGIYMYVQGLPTAYHAHLSTRSCVYICEVEMAQFSSRRWHTTEARWWMIEISWKGGDKDVSPAFKGLAVIHVAVKASGNDFQPQSVITGTSQPWIGVTYIPAWKWRAQYKSTFLFVRSNY